MREAREFLSAIDRHDLATLLKLSSYGYTEEERWFDITIPLVAVSSPTVFTEALRSLPDQDKKRILEAILSTDQSLPTRAISELTFVVNGNVQATPEEALFPEIVTQRNLMIEVAVGNVRIDDANDYYRARRRRIKSALQAMGIEDPNPFEDLWKWYGKWKTDLPPGWQSRRDYINEMYGRLLERLSLSSTPASATREFTGWTRVDRALAKARSSLEKAIHEEDFQSVGLLCREVIISLGQAVYDPDRHTSPDGVTPSDSDGRRMIESFLVEAVRGSSNEQLRKHAKASLSLAVELQHQRTASFREAALCVEAASSTVNVIAILSGRRDPQGLHGA